VAQVFSLGQNLVVYEVSSQLRLILHLSAQLPLPDFHPRRNFHCIFAALARYDIVAENLPTFWRRRCFFREMERSKHKSESFQTINHSRFSHVPYFFRIPVCS
jgi:hypothetical protein